MVSVTRIIGLLLVIGGVVAYIASGADSFTALAPAFVGVILFVLGTLAAQPERRAMMIHLALGVSVLGVLASFMPLRDLPALIRGDDVERPYAVATAGYMAVLCLIHVILGVRSFVEARRARAG